MWHPPVSAMPDTLVIDLDGTLVSTDLLHESVFGLLRLNPFYVFLLPLWLLRGKAHMKQMIADRVDLRLDLLPFHTGFLAWLREEHAAGRRLILATASNEKYAHGVAGVLRIFSDVIASDAHTNCSGARKLQQIQSLLGGESFAYAANAPVDLTVWRGAKAAVLVNAPPSVKHRVQNVCEVVQNFEGSTSTWRALLRAMRPHQWLKNLLIFVPLVLSHQFGNINLIAAATLAFISFSLCASSVYLLNDLLDVTDDRQHPTKRKRPFAAGELQMTHGVAALVVLLLAAFAVALLLPPYFLAILLLYYLSTMAYSIWLKRAAILDGLVLAGLYTLRLIAGAAAIAVAPTFWLLAFSIFIFLSLALIKRYSELLLVPADQEQNLAGRGYKPVDMETLAQLGTSSGYLAVLVLALYINGNTVSQLYTRPEALWILCPMMLYWVSRMWLLTRRGDMHDDPVVFTMRDVRTWILGMLAGLALLLATFWATVAEWLQLPV